MRSTQILFTTLGAAGVMTMLAAGCGDSEAVDDGGDGGAGGDATTASSTGNTGTMVTVSSSGTGGNSVVDESTSCADAPVIEEGQNGLMQPLFRSDDNVIGEPGDEDFFIIQGVEAGQWWQFGTDANPDDNPMLIDTVLSIYSEDGSTLLATVDDSYPRSSTDSEMFHRFAAAGNYCIKVEEFSSWTPDGTPEGGPSYIYDVFGIPIDFSAYDQHNVETEPNDTQTAADTNGDISVLSPDNTDQWLANFAGVTDAANDIDIFRFTAPTSAIGFDIDLTSPASDNGYGSTGGPGLVSVWDATFGLVAQVDATLFDAGLGGMSAVPVVAGETYYVSVEKPTGQTVGTNDFYFLKSVTRDASNPQEGGGVTPVDPGTNDTSAGAETPDSQDPQTLATGETVTSTFIGGEIPEGDVDYWTFDTAGMPQNGDQFTLICSSWAVGSGVRGLTVTLEDENGTPVQTGTEDQAIGVLWSDSTLATGATVNITGNGPFYVRLENPAATVDGAASATHYLCGLRRIQP